MDALEKLLGAHKKAINAWKYLGSLSVVRIRKFFENPII